MATESGVLRTMTRLRTVSIWQAVATLAMVALMVAAIGDRILSRNWRAASQAAAIPCYGMADDIAAKPERAATYIGKRVYVAGEAKPGSIVFNPAIPGYAAQVECGVLTFFLVVSSDKYPGMGSAGRVHIGETVTVLEIRPVDDGRFQVITSAH